MKKLLAILTALMMMVLLAVPVCASPNSPARPGGDSGKPGEGGSSTDDGNEGGLTNIADMKTPLGDGLFDFDAGEAAENAASNGNIGTISDTNVPLAAVASPQTGVSRGNAACSAAFAFGCCAAALIWLALKKGKTI